MHRPAYVKIWRENINWRGTQATINEQVNDAATCKIKIYSVLNYFFGVHCYVIRDVVVYAYLPLGNDCIPILPTTDLPLRGERINIIWIWKSECFIVLHAGLPQA